MTQALASTNAHTNAIIALLETIPNLKIGDAIGKANPLSSTPNFQPPFAVVYPLGGLLSGSLDAPEEDAEITWQVTYVGSVRQQAEFWRDKGREKILDGLDVEGRKIIRITVDTPGNVQRDNSLDPPLFICPERYRAWSVPDNSGS